MKLWPAGSELKNNIESQMAGSMGQNLKIPDEVFQCLCDLKYELTIDKKTSTIAKMDMDLSDFMHKLGSTLAKKETMPAEQKQVIKAMFESLQLKSTVTFSQFDSIGNIVIPEEAKK